MKISSINFETWCENHSHDHDAKWCRELYPWELFERIDYDCAKIGLSQKIKVGDQNYIATIEKCYTAENERLNYIIHLLSKPISKTQQWKQRAWDELFHLVAAQSGHFITLFTEKKDPSKVLLKKFLNANFVSVESARNLPVSGLLFRSLISYAAYETYNDLERFRSFQILDTNISKTNNKIKPMSEGSYEPFLSKDRELWIMYSFTEEKAHCQALRLIGQAKSIIVVFCHPTFSRHHRCLEKNCKILSLSEFLQSLSHITCRQYLKQARFLMNHLRAESDDYLSDEKSLNSELLLSKLETQQDIMPIHTSEIREAKAGLGMIVNTAAEVVYVCACANLLNAAMNKNLNVYTGSLKLSKEVYSFKAIFGRVIEEIIINSTPEVNLYVEPKGPIYVKVYNLQFSFHALPRTKIVKVYAASKQNILQDWCGIRLQKIAPLVLKLARNIMISNNEFFIRH